MNRALVSIATLGGIAVAYYATVGRYHQLQIDAHNREIDLAYAAFEHANAEAAQAPALESAVATLEQWRDELRSQLHFDPVTDPPLLQIKQMLEQAGLTVAAETLGTSPELRLPHQRLRIVVTGSFADLFTALQRLENSTPPTRVRELSVKPSGDQAKVRAEFVVVRTGGAA